MALPISLAAAKTRVTALITELDELHRGLAPANGLTGTATEREAATNLSEVIGTYHKDTISNPAFRAYLARLP
jgi:hypothetical protein